MLRVTRRARSQARVTKVASVLGALALGISLAACGSNIDPDDVQGLGSNNGNTGGQGGVINPDGTVPSTGGDGTVPDGSLPDDPNLPQGSDPNVPQGSDPSNPSGGDPSANPTGEPQPPKSGSCDGFKNQTGITDDTITIGNSSDISGPVPGLFEAAQDATKAYVEYFNKTSDICGRKLKLVLYDSRTDAAADQQSYVKACDEVFAMVGSNSAFDSGGAGTAQSCGLPDIRAAAVTNERHDCTTCFGAQSTNTGEHQNIVADYILKNYGSAGQHAGFLYINAGAAAQNAPVQASAMTKRGMHFDVVKGIDIAEFNYAPYVQELKDKKVEVVFWTGAYQQSVRLRQTMQQQGYTPKLYMRDPTDYIKDYVDTGGSAVDGTVIFTNFAMFSEANKNPEMALYLNYLQQVRPGADPTFFGVFAWSAAKLFTEKAIALGGDLDRKNLISEFAKTTKWTANNLHSPQNVGPKHTGDCWRFIKLEGTTWKSLTSQYECHGVTVG